MASLAPCRVRTLGRIHARPFHSTRVTKQGDSMLTLVIGGRGSVIIDGRSGEMELGDGMVGLVRGDEAGVMMCDPTQPYLHAYARFRGAYAESLVNRIREKTDDPFFRTPHVHDFAEELHRHSTIHRSDLPDQCGPEGLAILQILESIVSEVGRSADAPTAGSFEIVLRDYLEDHVAEPTDLSAIAAALSVSRSTLSRRCRAGLGRSVLEVHREIKIAWACELLRSTSASVSEVAARVGIADPFYFSRVFSHQRGLSPRAYRARGAAGGACYTPGDGNQAANHSPSPRDVGSRS